MGKRKREHEDDDYIRRKIRRLEDKLRKKRKRHNPLSRSSSSQSRDSHQSSYDSYDEANIDASIISESEVQDVEHQDQLIRSVVNTVPQETVTPLDQPSCSATKQNSTEPTETLTREVIPSEILDMLGEAKKLDPTLGETIPNEVAERWGQILLDGLAKEHKEALKEKMPVPENFTLVRAPKLNLEVASILSDSAKNRDKHLESAQNQLGTGIAGLVNLTKDLIKAQTVDKLNIIKRISEISQVLLDLHHEDTFNRRKLIVPLLDKHFWSMIKGVKRDEFLFGTKLGENIKSCKDIEKSSQQIKKTTPSTSTGPRRPGFQPGNVRGPPRRINNVSTMPVTSRNQPAAAPPPSSTRRTYNTTAQRNRYTASQKPFDKKRRH